MDNSLLFDWLEHGRQQISMANRPKGHVYSWETKIYSDLYGKRMFCSDAERLIKKLVRHFKLPNTEVFWNKKLRRFVGRAFYGDLKSVIHLKNPTTMGIVCHEIAHILAHHKYHSNQHHNKKFIKCFKIITGYVRKKYFSFFDTKKI